MAGYQMPDGNTYEFKDDAEATAAMQAWSKQFSKSPQVTDEFKKRSAVSLARGENPLLATASDFLAGATGTLRGGIDIVGSLFGKEKASQALFPTTAVDKDSGTYLAGSIADPYAQAIGMGGVKAAKAIRPAAGAVQNALGGALGGAAIGAASEDGGAIEGAALGAGISAVAPPVLSAAAKGAGWAIDALKGRLADIRAGKVLREVAGDELPKIRAALTAAGVDVSAAQAAAPVGSAKFSALGERAAKQDSQYYVDLAAKQEADRAAKIAGVSGGHTQEQALAAQKAAKDRLSMVTTPMRETELGAANMAGEVIRDLSPRIAQKQQSMESALQGQGRTVTESAQAGARNVEGKPGWISNADRSQEYAGAASDFSVIKGQRQSERDFMQGQIDSLSAYGLTPLNTDKIISKISSSVSDPKLAGSKPIQSVMSNVANEIADWTAKNGGVIDAQALYSIRKNAVAAEVARLNPAADSKAQAKLTASVLEKVNPLIDDAIEKAGGTGWKDYLRTYSDGMQEINKMKLGAKAMEALQTSPDAFVKLVKGNNPKAVQKIFASDFDFTSAMNDKASIFSGIANELERDKFIKSLAGKGADEVAGILEKNAAKLKLPPTLSRQGVIANAAIGIAESNLNKKVMAKVYNAMRNGKDAAALMDQLSATEKNLVLKGLINGNLQPYLSSAAVAGSF